MGTFDVSSSRLSTRRHRPRRRAGVAAAILAVIGVFVASGLRASPAQAGAGCAIHSLPSLVEEEPSNVEDVVELGCEPVYAGDTVKVSSAQLDSACGGNLSWSSPYPFSATTGSGVTVKLTGAANATLALWGGPGCFTGTDSISAQLEQPPFETVTTSLEVLPPQLTTPGVYAQPSTQVEDKVYESAATVVEVSLSPDEVGDTVLLRSAELYQGCAATPHLAWIGPSATVLAGSAEEVKVTPDLDGHAYVVVLGGRSCLEASNLIEAFVEQAPFTEFSTDFTIKAPPLLPASPSATIKSPAGGKTYEPGALVKTTFSCTEGSGGVGLESCADSNGSSGTAGTLDTLVAGPHVYTVTATSKDGLTGSAQIGYNVVPKLSRLSLAYKSPLRVGPIERGDPIYFRATNVELSASSAKIQCASAQLTGAMLTNGFKTDQFEATEGASFNGGPGGGACTSATLGNVVVDMTPGQWSGTFKTSGTSSLNGAPDLELGLSYGAGTACHYTATSMKGHFNTNGSPIAVSTARAPFKLDSGAPNTQGCPKTARLTATWQLTTSLPGSGEEFPAILTASASG